MRLLNTSKITLHEFYGEDIPPYAILSHRWETDEVTFQDLQAETFSTKAGYSKIQNCCAQAAKDYWNWVWIDSCCIDKSSSAELSEAINSMFQWYRDSDVCYAYLSDVSAGLDYDFHVTGSFKLSKWFQRGWTLQEMLAPDEVVFFDRSWVDIGTRSTFEAEIISITGIRDVNNYVENNRLGKYCVAEKMSWASARKTTRIEDEAYCLMGILDVNMPLLYGEGSKAFLRLQVELLKISEDESIFAWATDIDERTVNTLGLFARSAADFKIAGNFRMAPELDAGELGVLSKFRRLPYPMTNKGLQIVSTLILQLVSARFSRFLMPLNVIQKDKPGYLAITMECSVGEDTFRRTSHAVLHSVALPSADSKPTMMFIKQEGSGRVSKKIQDSHQVSRSTTLDVSSVLAAGFVLLNTNIRRTELVPWNTSSKHCLEVPSNTLVPLLFSRGTLAQFVLILDTNMTARTVHLYCPREYLTNVDTTDLLCLYAQTKNPRGARGSIKLPSGESVNVEYHRKGDYFQMKQKAMGWVSITVDRDGKLKWPACPFIDLEPIETLEPEHSQENIESLDHMKSLELTGDFETIVIQEPGDIL